MRYFVSLARTGSITKAAELHRISPPAFSKAIRVFQGEIGHELTLPSGRGIVLTDYAKSLVPLIENILKQMDQLKLHTDSQIRSQNSQLRIATFEVFSTYFMSKVFKEFFKDFSCELYEAIPGKMEELVVNGKVDFALTYVPIPHPDLDFLKIQEIEMGIFGNSKSMKSQKLSDCRFVVPSAPIEGSPNKVRGLDGWPDDHFPRNQFYQVELLETAIGLCREGLAVAYLPKFVVRLYNEVVKSEYQLYPLEFPKKISKSKSYVYLVKRKTDVEGDVTKRFAKAIRQFCK